MLDEPDVVAFLDRRPVFKGHVLVVPRAHVVDAAPISRPSCSRPLFGAAQRCATAMLDGARRAGLVGRA